MVTELDLCNGSYIMKLLVYLSLEIDILKTLVIRCSKIILTLKTNLSVHGSQVCYGWLALINN